MYTIIIIIIIIIMQRLTRHVSVIRLKNRMGESVYLSGIMTVIKEMAAKCPDCVRYQTEQQKEPLMSHPAPEPPVVIRTDNGNDESSTSTKVRYFFKITKLTLLLLLLTSHKMHANRCVVFNVFGPPTLLYPYLPSGHGNAVMAALTWHHLVKK